MFRNLRYFFTKAFPHALPIREREDDPDANGLPNLNTYWADPGLLMAGEYPGCDDAQAAGARLRRYLDAGIRVFIDLTEEGELASYKPHLAELAAQAKLPVRHLRFAMPDDGLPYDRGHLTNILDVLAQARSENSPAYIHCHGGTGRTGLVVACWFIEQGYSPAEALAKLDGLWRQMPSSLRKTRSPSTDAQHDWVMNWRRVQSTAT